MANANVIQGLVPCADNKGSNNIRPMIPVSASVNTETDLFPGSAYYLDTGTVCAVPHAGDETDDTALIAGAVVKLYNSSKREVQNLPSDTDGYADVTYQEDQEYLITINDGNFSSPADNGMFYNLTAETREDADTNGFDGSASSGLQLDGNSEAAAAKQFIVCRMEPTVGNVDASSGTLVRARINPDNWQAW